MKDGYEGYFMIPGYGSTYIVLIWGISSKGYL
jgi:hypothetical protein